MEEVNGILLNSFPLKELIKVSDLIYFDGPLLSHFQTKNKDNYLFYWVDVNETHNRWLILRTSLDKLQAFVGKKISLLELVQHPDDNFLYKVDISANLNYENVAYIS